MTIDPKQAAFGPENIERRIEADMAQESDRPERASRQGNNAGAPSKGRHVTRLEVRRSTGLWQVTRDGRFHGRYHADHLAFEAAETVALDVVANGGVADLWWNDLWPPSGESGHAAGVATRGVSRTIEFRSDSTRIVR